MVCFKDPLVQTICELYENISKLETLNPSKDANALFTKLVETCIPPHPIDVSKLCTKVQNIRTKLIHLCGQAEGLLEKHYSAILGSLEKPLDNLGLFPYYSNYIKLGRLEYELLVQHCPNPTRFAFIGSGPLPLTSIVLASNHLTSATFHNYDIDGAANSLAAKLVDSHPDLSKRMVFHTNDIMNVPAAALKEYDVVFLAALVGMDIEDKMHVVEYLSKNMAPGAILMLRSAHGARAFLYPVVEPRDLRGFEVLSVYHPTDEVVNSVVIVRKCTPITPMNYQIDQGFDPRGLCSKCGEIQEFNRPLGRMNMGGKEFALEGHIC